MSPHASLRKELLSLLDGENAHMTLQEAVSGFVLEEINRKPPLCPYSFWHMLEHIRIAQWDILEFIVNPDHVSPVYPQGYRPRPETMADQAAWQETIAHIEADGLALRRLVADPQTELLLPLPHAPDYSILREILVVADHNAYHIGEFAMMRQVTGLWPADRPYLTGRPD